jgi:hypothetical protein
MGEFRRANFRPHDLRKVGDPPPPDVPPLVIGDHCTLNSGSPNLLVVDTDGDDLTVAWKDAISGVVAEHLILRACVRRAPANAR